MVSRHEVQRISDFAEIKTGPFGSALHQADYKATGTPIVTVEHLGERGIIHENLPLVGEEDLKRLSTYKCREGDILFSRVGSIDRNAIVKREEVDWLFSGRLLRVRVDRRKVDSGYLSQVFHTESFKDKVRSVAVGQTMPSLNTQILGGLTVNLPSLDEQKVVAGRLGSADQLIESLKRLVSKKQAIKQGIMQELLSGRNRLPGFVEPWARRNFSEITHRVATKKFQIPASSYLRSGLIPVVDQGKRKIIGYTNNVERAFRPGASGVIVFGDHTCISKFVDFPFVVGADGTQIIRASLGMSARFLSYVLQFDPVESTGYNRHLKFLLEKEIFFPTLEEQESIASILRDVDREIDTLGIHLVVAQNIKQGMMQELLTGPTRLPVEEVAP